MNLNRYTWSQRFSWDIQVDSLGGSLVQELEVQFGKKFFIDVIIKDYEGERII